MIQSPAENQAPHRRESEEKKARKDVARGHLEWKDERAAIFSKKVGCREVVVVVCFCFCLFFFVRRLRGSEVSVEEV